MEDFFGLAKLILQRTKEFLGDKTFSVTVQCHTLDAEEIGNSVHFTKHCGSVRPAICLCKGSNRLVKRYPGMGTRHQSNDIVSCVVTVKDMACMAQLLAALVDATGTVPNALKFCAQGIWVYCEDQLPNGCRKSGEEVFDDLQVAVPRKVRMFFVDRNNRSATTACGLSG